MTDTPTPKPPTPVRQTKPFKPSRAGIAFHLKRDFGFVPEMIIIQNAGGCRIVVNAVMTDAELNREKSETLSQAVKDAENSGEKKPSVGESSGGDNQGSGS